MSIFINIFMHIYDYAKILKENILNIQHQSVKLVIVLQLILNESYQC
jgi:hypothetical protein